MQVLWVPELSSSVCVCVCRLPYINKQFLDASRISRNPTQSLYCLPRDRIRLQLKRLSPTRQPSTSDSSRKPGFCPYRLNIPRTPPIRMSITSPVVTCTSDQLARIGGSHSPLLRLGQFARTAHSTWENPFSYWITSLF